MSPPGPAERWLFALRDTLPPKRPIFGRVALKTLNGKRILVAPLDWGLGHATRCIPIIRAIEERGGSVVIGADGGPLALLRGEFPDAEFARLPGIEVTYSARGDQRWHLLRQFPSLLASIRTEHALWNDLQQGLKVDAVISDQRFGIRSEEVPSILITHQVFPNLAFGRALLHWINTRLIGRFDRCWIMDGPAAPGSAGKLSHGKEIPDNARYIDIQSRFGTAMPGTGNERYDIVAVISGPEPQRSLLEKTLLMQLGSIPGQHLLVQGLPVGSASERKGTVMVVPHLVASDLEQLLRSCRMIVSRSGYTTLMDLAALGRSALLIPTPGQPEQEYLGRLHQRIGRHLVQRQDQLDLLGAWQQRGSMPDRTEKVDPTLLASALDELAELLSNHTH